MFGAYLICVIAFVFILSKLGSALLGMAGVPNILPLVRDGALFILALMAIRQIKFSENRLFYGSMLAIIFLLILYVFVSIFEDRHFMGIYYARLYILPLLFAIACQAWFIYADTDVGIKIVRLTYILGCVVMLIAIALYIATQLDSALLGKLLGGIGLHQLDASWFIAGGWIRMGLPATAPNHLGLIAALFLILLVSIKFSGSARFFRLRWFALSFVLTGIVLAMTFSRSSWIAALVGLLTLLFVCRQEWKINASFVFRATLATVVGISLLAVCIYFLDDYSDGIISNWVSMNFTGKDPSLIGHGSSLVQAWESFDEYYLWGYPRGTVGPRAKMFGGDMNNVENTIVSIYYDMGFQMGTLFIILSGFMLFSMFRHVSQVAPFVSFFVAGMVLPYSTAPEICIFYLFIYAVIGVSMRMVRNEYVNKDSDTSGIKSRAFRRGH